MQQSSNIVAFPQGEIGRGTVAPLRRSSAPVCPSCKCEMQDGVINWVKTDFDRRMKMQLVPCPTCSKDLAQRRVIEEQVAHVSHLLGSAALPWRATRWTWESTPPSVDARAKATVQAFVRRHLEGDTESKRMLYLAGAPGVGKTGLAVCALKQAIQTGKTGLFLLTADLLMKLAASFRHGDISQDQVIEAAASVTWLVLDDLAVESGAEQRISAYTLKTLYLLLQKRADRGLYTILTSNLSLNDLEAYWRPPGLAAGAMHEGSRIVDRLRQYAEGCPVLGANVRKGQGGR